MLKIKDRITVLIGLIVVAASIIWALELRGRHIYCSADPRCPQPADISLIGLRITIVIAGVIVAGLIILGVRSITRQNSRT